MLEHIVKYNEKVDDIINIYHITIDELKYHNTHITDFNNLQSGVKLLIPLISQEVEQVLKKTEGFVMEYYPKITEDIIPSMSSIEEEQVLEKGDNMPIKENIDKQVLSSNLKSAYPGILPPNKPYKGRL